MIYINLSIKVLNCSIKPAITCQKYSALIINIYMCNARSKIKIMTRAKQKQMSLKLSRKTIRTLRLSQYYLVLFKKSLFGSKFASFYVLISFFFHNCCNKKNVEKIYRKNQRIEIWPMSNSLDWWNLRKELKDSWLKLMKAFYWDISNLN